MLIHITYINIYKLKQINISSNIRSFALSPLTTGTPYPNTYE